ncbi:MAG: hypothetical protein AAB583_04565 [Patescibacteria group bacterium]
MQQIRLTKTQELEKVLSYLKDKYSLLSEAEIIKLALSEKYHRDLKPVENDAEAEKERELRKAYRRLMKEGKKIGDRLMKEKGLDPKKVSEQQFHDLFLDDHEHNA